MTANPFKVGDFVKRPNWGDSIPAAEVKRVGWPTPRNIVILHHPYNAQSLEVAEDFVLGKSPAEVSKV